MCLPERQQITELAMKIAVILWNWAAIALSSSLFFFDSFFNELGHHASGIGVILAGVGVWYRVAADRAATSKLNAELAEMKHRRKCD